MYKNIIPTHIAFIMDGNGRWAKERGFPRTAGHHEGVQRVKEIIRGAQELGIKVVTFFAFSSENWKRPKSEISVLMRYLEIFLSKEIRELQKRNIRFRVIGREHPIPLRLLKKLRESQEKTKDNTSMTVVLALNYGGQQEIVDAAKRFAAAVERGEIKAGELTPENFKGYLYTKDLPDPDLLIRTSGEMRISNFLLWQLSYAELYFAGKYWPDFHAKDLEEAIEEYSRRERRFGDVDVREKSR